MSINDLARLFEEAERTPEYQFEAAVVDITEEICQIMKDRGISRADLARELGKSRAWVTKVLRGDQNLTLKTIVDILWVLGFKIKKIQTEPFWSGQWTQSVERHSSDAVVRMYPSWTPNIDMDEYEDEQIEEAMEAGNVQHDLAA